MYGKTFYMKNGNISYVLQYITNTLYTIPQYVDDMLYYSKYDNILNSQFAFVA